MNSQLRKLALSRQGLLLPEPFGVGIQATRLAIEHLGYVQIDSLSVVERAHHHVLWNRVPGYDPSYLNQLIKERTIFEYWYHAASYLPMRDFRFALPQMTSIRRGENRYYTNVDSKLMAEILARVRADGPIKARDLKKNKVDKNKGNWWNWSGSKRALDKLFMQGDLMVCHRNGIEKVFDLTERCLPEGIDLTRPTTAEYASYLFETTSRSHGIFTWKQLLHLKKGKPIRDAMKNILDEYLDAGLLKTITNEGSPTAYINIEALEKVSAINAEQVKILSPFDNLLIHRDRLNSLFDFDFRIECYVPRPNRVYGYFCLPILYGDKLVGRIDCKAHRAEGRFEIFKYYLEDGFLNHDQFVPALIGEIQLFADFNKCPLLEASIITHS